MSTEQGSAAGPECIAVQPLLVPRAAQLQLLAHWHSIVKELHSFGLLTVAGNSAHGSVSDGRDRPPHGAFSYLYFRIKDMCIEVGVTRREFQVFPRPVVVDPLLGRPVTKASFACCIFFGIKNQLAAV